MAQTTYIISDPHTGLNYTTTDPDVCDYYIANFDAYVVRLSDMHQWDLATESWIPVTALTSADIPDDEDDADDES